MASMYIQLARWKSSKRFVLHCITRVLKSNVSLYVVSVPIAERIERPSFFVKFKQVRCGGYKWQFSTDAQWQWKTE